MREQKKKKRNKMEIGACVKDKEEELVYKCVNNLSLTNKRRFVFSVCLPLETIRQIKETALNRKKSASELILDLVNTHLFNERKD